MAKPKIIRRRVIEDAGVQRPAWEQVGRYMYCFGQLEQALGDLLHQQPESWKSRARLIVKDCKKFIDERNMFCHGAFAREADGTVRFEYISMKGREPAVPSWSDALFNARCKELERLERGVSSLYPAFRPTTYVLRAGSI